MDLLGLVTRFAFAIHLIPSGNVSSFTWVFQTALVRLSSAMTLIITGNPHQFIHSERVSVDTYHS